MTLRLMRRQQAQTLCHHILSTHSHRPKHLEVPMSPAAAHSASEPPKILTKSGTFGEISLLQNCPRTMTVTTLEPCVFLTLTRRRFHRFLRIAPECRTAIKAFYKDYPQSPEPYSPSLTPTKRTDDADEKEWNSERTSRSRSADESGILSPKLQSASTTTAPIMSSAFDSPEASNSNFYRHYHQQSRLLQQSRTQRR